MTKEHSGRYTSGRYFHQPPSVHDPLGVPEHYFTTCRMAASAVIVMVTSLLTAPRVLGITLDVGSLESLRPPPLPPHQRSSGFPIRPAQNRPPATQFNLQQPSITIAGNVRNLKNPFIQLQQNLPPGQQNRPLPQLLETTKRRPQHFSEVQALPQTFGFSVHDVSNKLPSDSFVSASTQQTSFNLQSHLNTPPFIHQTVFPQPVLGSSNRQPQQLSSGIVTTSQQNTIISQTPSDQKPSPLPVSLPSSILQQLGLNSQLQSSSLQSQQLPNSLISTTAAVQQETLSPAENLLIQNPNILWNKTPTQAELFSGFNASFFGGQFQQDALKITSPPVLGSAVQNQPANDANKKALLKDVISEDCPKAKQDGFCASPIRYPSQQISQLISRCSEILKILYVPVPQEDEKNITVKNDSEEKLSLLSHFNSTREMQRGNRQLWSWAKAALEQETACGSQRQWVEPGYVRDSNGRWYVVLQAGESLAQRVHLETCHTPGKPCSAIKCSSFSSKLASSHCVQRFSHSHLVVWDPDQQETCPQLRVFRFPTACVCHLGP